jgi:hypothetical protein
MKGFSLVRFQRFHQTKITLRTKLGEREELENLMAGRSLGPAREAHSQMGSGRFCVSVNVYLLVFSTFPDDYENQLFRKFVKQI